MDTTTPRTGPLRKVTERDTSRRACWPYDAVEKLECGHSLYLNDTHRLARRRCDLCALLERES